MTAKTETKQTVNYIDFFTDPYPGLADDAVVSWEETCQRCGGQGGSEAWKMTGYNCYLCGGKRPRWTVTSTAGDERRKAKQRAQYRAGVERKRLAALAVRDERTIGLADEHPVLANLSFAGLNDLDAHLTDWAHSVLADLIVSTDKRPLSEKQIALAEKLLTEAIEKRDGTAKTDETPAGVAPTGEKVEMTVTVVKIKIEDNNFSYHGGTIIKMMGTGTDENGHEYRVHMTAPKKMLDASGDDDFRYYNEDNRDRWISEHPLVGRTFSFVARTVTTADDDTSICFPKNPSKLKMH